ncbi:MAG: signal peptide peptidase SppA [Gammaproteobacteria bacterium]|nr:signal peptide peptidase SppA [Gammaproteobacteria bacterium]
MLGRIFRFLWAGVDGFRKVVHLFLMIAVFAALLAALGSGSAPARVTDGSVLLLNPSGALVHELQGSELDIELQRMSDEAAPETLVRDVVRALRHAAEDERIVAVRLDTEGLAGGGLTKLQDIAAAMREFRESGKPIISYSRFYSQTDYFLAAQSDEVHLHDMGGVDISGLGRWRLYFAEALRKLDIDAHVFRVGEYKSFVEPYFRDSMSAEDRESAEQWLGALWNEYQREVTEARGLEPDALDRYAESLTEALEAVEGDLAKVNLEAGLVDFIQNDEKFSAHMEERFGDEENGDYNRVSFADYLVTADRENPPYKDDENNVAVVTVAGAITDGSAPPGAAAGDSIAKLVRHAAEEDDIKALVLQVDSPGGSAFASEVISAAVSTVSQAGKPVVVSMSSVAASGGYYISAEADEIWAYPGTITGSIGVGTVLFTAPRLLDRLGLSEDGIGTTPLSEHTLIDRDLPDGARRQVDSLIGRIYDRFVGHVSKGRGLSFEEVDAIGRGRVWIGSDAASHSLVDQIGTVEDAIASAAALAGLEEGKHGTLRLKRKRPFFSGFAGLVQIRWAQIRHRLGFRPEPDRFMETVQQARQVINAELDRLARFNDPRGYYYLCGACSAY